MTINKTDSKAVIQCYTNSDTHLEIKKVAKLRRLSVSKLCELVITDYVKEFLESHEKKEAAKTKELRNLRGY